MLLILYLRINNVCMFNCFQIKHPNPSLIDLVTIVKKKIMNIKTFCPSLLRIK